MFSESIERFFFFHIKRIKLYKKRFDEKNNFFKKTIAFGFLNKTWKEKKFWNIPSECFSSYHDSANVHGKMMQDITSKKNNEIIKKKDSNIFYIFPLKS